MIDLIEADSAYEFIENYGDEELAPRPQMGEVIWSGVEDWLGTGAER
jgi:hypothetical protein